MLYWALAFLVIALVASVLGFGGMARAFGGVARVLFGVFLALFNPVDARAIAAPRLNGRRRPEWR